MRSEDSLLEVIEVREAGRIRVRLPGEFDLASAPIVREGLRWLRDCGEAVRVDLDVLAFIDMSGLRMVLVAARESSRDGWLFTVMAGSAQVRRLISLVSLDRPLPLDGCST